MHIVVYKRVVAAVYMLLEFAASGLPQRDATVHKKQENNGG